MTRAEWLRDQDRKRQLVAAGYAAALYLAAFLAAWGFGLLKRQNLAEVPGTMLVNLSDFEGPPGGKPLGLETAPERPPNAPVTPPAPPAEKPAAKVPASAPPPAPAPARPAASANAPSFEPAPKQPEPQPAAAAATAATPEAAPLTEPYVAAEAPQPTSKSFGTPQADSGSAPGIPGGSGSVTFRGSEKGNALDTTFGASSGTVGRSLYVPIWGYMPLPARVAAATYAAIPADKDGFYSAEVRKKTFRQYYQESGGEWTLKSPVPLNQRLALWIMLEDAGYDLGKADYKAALVSASVVLEFAVGPAAGSAKPSLIDISIVTSSGSKDIDEAVLYGFRQAAFFNKNAFAVSGRFTYRFGK